MVRTTECMISTIYLVVNINKYYIKFSLTNDVVGGNVAVAVAAGGVVVGGVGVGGSGLSEIASCAACVSSW